jgi:hypothetical protein
MTIISKLTPSGRATLAYAATSGANSQIRTFLNKLLRPHEGHEVKTYPPARADVLFAFECVTCGPASKTLVTFSFTQPATLSDEVVVRS